MFKHNKKRNSYIVYEQLMTLVTKLAASKNDKEASYIVKFAKEHFGPKTEIKKELRLLEAMLDNAGLLKEDAEKLLKETLSQAKEISVDKLNKEKNKLIEDINKNISKELFNVPLKNFKTIASAYILLNEAMANNKTTTPLERVKIKSLLVERISSAQKEEKSDAIDNFTFRVLINKFNKKYSPVINETQKNLLSAWVMYNVDENEEKMRKVINENISYIKKNLSQYLGNKQVEKEEFKEPLKEAYRKLKEENFDLNEDNVYQLMRYMDLVEDLNSHCGNGMRQ